MALLLKVIEWADNTQDTMVYRVPMEGREINFGSKLVVRESQKAVFVVKGKIADVFEPGTHTLAVANLPIVSKLLALPFGFKQPFTAEIYYVNTKQFANQKWGTANPITMRDQEFGMVRIRAYGKYSFKVSDPTVFLKELFGTNSTFKTADINDYLRSMLIAGISDTIAESKISAIDLACNLLEFNKKATEQVAGSFTNLGLALANIVVENISFPEQVEKAIDMRSSMGVMNDKMDTFVKYQAANAMREGVNNPNGMGGLGVQLGTGAAVGQMMSEALKPQQPAQAAAPAAAPAAVKHCTSCGAKLAATAKFCGECGAKQVAAAATCPSCGAKKPAGAKFCGECGHKF